jgi:arabinan endo-1,5-alpha-L-arabinosidase
MDVTRPAAFRRAATAALIGALVLMIGVFAVIVYQRSSDAGPRPTDPIAHDPTMVTEGDWYYVAITGDLAIEDTYIPLKRSQDLVHWEELGPAFTQFEPWVLEALGVEEEDAPDDAWAPDLFWTGAEWRLYYSASQFGTNNSVIGLMTSPSLEQPEWVDQGLVIRSERGNPDTPYNAIDPNVVVDAEGDQWLTFGSFFSGIQLVPLDPVTGKVAPGEEPVRIARREAPPYAQENPAIVLHDGFYYLFQAYDFCCRGLASDYRTVVGRSESITGPYVDRDGLPLMNAAGGTEVITGEGQFIGTGGADVMLEGDGDTGYIVNHYYDAIDNGVPRLNVRPLTWTDDGWPVVGEPLNAGRPVEQDEG